MSTGHGSRGLQRSEATADVICMADASLGHRERRGDLRTYRSRQQAVIGSGAAVATLGVAIAALADPTARHHGGYIIAVLALMAALGMARFARCGVNASASGVRVMRMFSTTDLAWDQIREFTLSQVGACQISLNDGSRVSIVGIEQTNLAAMTGRRNTPERHMIEDLNRLLSEHAQSAASPASTA